MKQNLISQMGRSMVEVLGALSIMGILSLTAVLGYSYAIDKHNSNETTNDVNVRMSDLMLHLETKENITKEDLNVLSSDWSGENTIYPMDFVYDDVEDGIEYAVEVVSVPKRVCQFIFENLIDKYVIEVGEERYVASTETDLCSEYETMAFYLRPEGGNVCLEGQKIANGQCVDCVADEDCEDGFICENHVCTCVVKECPNSEFTDTLCACCASNLPKWVESDGACHSCADIDVDKPVYNTETKECEACPDATPIWNGTSCEACPDETPIWNGLRCEACPTDKQIWDSVNKKCVECVQNSDCGTAGFVCTNNLCECAQGTNTPCVTNFIQTVKTSVYEQMCYICSCPSGSTMSGDTCVCNNECQTYNTSTKTCTNKTNGTTCSSGLCLNGSCKDDTCPSASSKTCSANLIATASSKTAYGTQCYTCACPSGSTLSSDGTTCVCNNECQTYNTSTKTCSNKANGSTCSSGLCLNGSCKNDTCPTGQKSCASGMVATASSKTAYGTQCYTCSCSSNTPYWNGSACVTCASVDVTKPYWNGSSCSTCPTSAIYYNASTGQCEANECLLRLYNAGAKNYLHNIVIASGEIYIVGNVNISKDLNWSGCTLCSTTNSVFDGIKSDGSPAVITGGVVAGRGTMKNFRYVNGTLMAGGCDKIW